MADPEAPKQQPEVPLTLTQRVAIQAAFQQVTAAQAQLRAIMVECGLNPDKQHNMTATGAQEVG